MTIRGVVFDLDGVLINSELCWKRAREAFAAERGALWTQALQTQSMGTGSDYWLRRMQQHVAPDIPTDALRRCRNSRRNSSPGSNRAKLASLGKPAWRCPGRR